MNAAQPSLHKIIGLVTACDWDALGNPIHIKLCADNEKDYLVADNELEKRLLKYLKSWVEVQGYLGDREILEIISIDNITEKPNGGFS